MLKPDCHLVFYREIWHHKDKNIRKGRKEETTVNEGLQEYAQRLRMTGQLEASVYGEMMRFRDAELTSLVCEYALQTRKERAAEEIQWLGTIDISSYCKNDCYYCGLRRDNRFAGRYRMEAEEIFACCEAGLQQGITNYLIQGGEDLWYTTERVTEIIRGMKRLSKDITILLSLGERSRAVYQTWKMAGADGYLLCYQTSDDRSYHRLHPVKMSLLRKKQCLWELKELGYLVGTGFMIGTPYQRITDLADEFAFLRQLAPDMMMVETFLASDGTPFEKERNGVMDLTYFVMALLRLSFPKLYMPVAQTVELFDRDGIRQGVRAGADMVSVDLTQEQWRQQYHCYRRSAMRGKIGLENIGEFRKSLQEAEYEIAGLDEHICRR